ncbi:N-6 DNA methylase [Paenarthrobacter aurescens]|uniref:N-6 DNA methylase n=1 Tax=Paenarthrobacter aurescens TaxID=43663 RepID=UPI0021BF94FD|nr:N-6 DNA methylase [Paenarthrobacter aurescens]MCT9868718.1 N-6 DNA methylase [Paenarthrobacter aurescens]
MANEELQQREYLSTGSLKGDSFGRYESLNLGATNLTALVAAGLVEQLPAEFRFACSVYKRPARVASLKPDQIIMERIGSDVRVVAVHEHKPDGAFTGKTGLTKLLGAQEQALVSADALGAKIAACSDGTVTTYVDVEASVSAQAIVLYEGTLSQFTDAEIDKIRARQQPNGKDPAELAESVWQLIWHASKAEPKECLLTFVELFVLKFLSDNLPLQVLPKDYSFAKLMEDPATFKTSTGVTQIEYYIRTIRPKIKSIFPDNTFSKDSVLKEIFGQAGTVSKTSIINGFVFLKSGDKSADSWNSTFVAILNRFKEFGVLTNIDPEFKLRLYETFLKKSARQQQLGQFFTPRNIVKPIVDMSQMAKLPDGAVVLDPAAGVGGFVLEPLLWSSALAGNIKLKNGEHSRRVTTVGVDVDADLHILAKANMLLHLAEQVRDPSVSMQALNTAMADTFVLMDENKTLGSLLHPPRNAADLILTNPPYVTRGSAIYRDTLKSISGKKNGELLKDYYSRSGLGLEGLFLRYISGALKPGGRAFVIVPQGMLNRTEISLKSQVLQECNLIASLQLPRNAFFNTSQSTYLLVIEKRFTPQDERPKVFCAIVRSIGESLDARRLPTPSDNDLADISKIFIDWTNEKQQSVSPVVKWALASEFSAESRWDVTRFWNDAELVKIGEAAAPVARENYLTETKVTLEELLQDLTDTQAELDDLMRGEHISLPLSDKAGHFVVRSGTRIKTVEIMQNPPLDEGDRVTVYSCFKNEKTTKGDVSKKYLESRTVKRRNPETKKFEPQPEFYVEENRIVTVNANGSVGWVFVREPGCLITDDVIAVEPVVEGISLDYLALALQKAASSGGFIYEAKLFAARVKELTVEIPVDENGDHDMEQQQKIAAATRRFQLLTTRIADLGRTAATSRFV